MYFYPTSGSGPMFCICASFFDKRKSENAKSVDKGLYLCIGSILVSVRCTSVVWVVLTNHSTVTRIKCWHCRKLTWSHSYVSQYHINISKIPIIIVHITFYDLDFMSGGGRGQLGGKASMPVTAVQRTDRNIYMRETAGYFWGDLLCCAK